MQTLILKFGGASVSSPENFLKIAHIIMERAKETPHLVVVVSAMGDTTDELLSLARKIHPNPPKREQDMLVSAGERISIALLAMALKAEGKEAISFTGSQSGIITCARHSEARIVEVRPHRLIPQLQAKKIVIVAGFQGMGLNGEITTLGRGGSDTSAVALGVALRAKKVEFYKDVEGIHTEDPKENPKSTLFSYLSYERALEVVSNERGVLHRRCIELAKQNQMALQVLSYQSFCGNEGIKRKGTWIGATSSSSPPSYEISLETEAWQEGACI